MNVFELRDRLTSDYSAYVRSFIQIRDARIRQLVESELDEGLLWPQPLIQLNPAFESGDSIEALVDASVLHEKCRSIFRLRKRESGGPGSELRLHTHQSQAIRIARNGANYVLTTGTGSGKSLAYIIPIVDFVLRQGSGRGIQAMVVYPMNALANSQYGELQKFLCDGFADGKGPVKFERYTGQESEEDRERIIQSPPDILLTNYVMLELLLTRVKEKPLIASAKGLRFLVLDELHTYRGRQGADVALLVRRTRDALEAKQLQCVGTSATLASEGTYHQQQAKIAETATRLFGAQVKPEHVVGETLRRATPDRQLDDPAFVRELSARVADNGRRLPTTYDAFVRDPLSVWIESTFGVQAEPESGRLIRARPRSILGPEGAAKDLSRVTGVSEPICAQAIMHGLLAGYQCQPNPQSGFKPFAFRLHQFISRGDTVYASPEPEDKRHITLHGQQFVPGDRERVLLPLVFCRECGQEYRCVRRTYDKDAHRWLFGKRDLIDMRQEQGTEIGFLYASTDFPWPHDEQEITDRLPDDWLEERNGIVRVKKSKQDDLPRHIQINTRGQEEDSGLECVFIPAPFRFCLHCGVAYAGRQTSDFGKLTSLGTEGRSTATTILSLSVIRRLRHQTDLPERARKLLSFTDNRQDASLQSGHFNDFVEIGLLRAALYKAAKAAGSRGVSHEDLPQRVFDAMQLPISAYAVDPTVRFAPKAETERALRNVIGYRLYLDLRRGWRITAPNLEQCGLLEIKYQSLDEVCEAQDVWQNRHPALAGATPQTRAKIAKVLLDFMRRELAIKVDYLDPRFQERMVQLSSQKLIPPWAIDENERPEHAAILLPRAFQNGSDFGGNVYLSARGGFGQYLRRPATLPEYGQRFGLADTQTIIEHLLDALRVAGLVEVVIPPERAGDVPGYQLPASAMVWCAGNGDHAFNDPIRIPRESAFGHRINPFFTEFYQVVARELQGYHAREHTAQVPSEKREEREKAFREARLPILFCSPTMELGVDISELNVVNMRNIPPTPANYAQRSGRAGRSGQPALVFSYCSTGSSHDQYFFRRPQRMVAGAVAPPRLDLANEDLVRAHVQAVWLAETGLSLGSSLKDLLDISGLPPSLALLESVREQINREEPRKRAMERTKRILSTISKDLESADWYAEKWLEDTLRGVGQSFEQACERWRGLYRSALAQRDVQNRIIGDATRSMEDKARARRLRQESESQLDLLLQSVNMFQSDFYSYRYFASEGFLPGYSFPRLPISAYVPGRRTRDEFLSRPRFLAISEFGPRAIVYHEGSKYEIQRAILPLRDANEGGELPLHQVKVCPTCGYAHALAGGQSKDLCDRCAAPLGAPMSGLFRLQNVATRRRDKINCDEEERMRLGYEIRTAIRFAEVGGQPSYRIASVEAEGNPTAKLMYGQAAHLWRINVGWSRRKNREQLGFLIDLERGDWARSEEEATDNGDDPLGPRTARVVPYVDDSRNCLLFEPQVQLSVPAMASLQAALKNAIQIEYQLEDNELAAEPLPNSDERKLILIYEAAEGGAGVLRRLLDDPQAMSRVAKQALDLCHFDPADGSDRRRAEKATEDCEAACYDCLMNYGNQRDHKLLDRQQIKGYLRSLAVAQVKSSPAPRSRNEHLEQLLRQAGSELERQWLQWLDGRNLRLPSGAQVLISSCNTRPDFAYEAEHTVVYVDGPPHDYPDRQSRDAAQQEMLEDSGLTVIRFRHQDDWARIVERSPHVFGAGAS